MDNKIELDISLSIKDLCDNKYIKYKQYSSFYNKDDIFDNTNIEDLICPICLNILINPINCSDKKNSHSFCKKCINKYLRDKNNCPICKLFFEYKINNEINTLLNKLSFKCIFKTEGCNNIISYSEYFNHINNCKYNNKKYECQIKIYNYKNKKFEIYGYLENENNIINHYKLCGYIEYKCIFCNEHILQMNLEEHVKNKCKFKIINYQNEEKYLGENYNNRKEGYGIYYYSDGGRYEGEFKNDKKEGYGIDYYSNGGRYEGEYKNDNKEGYGIYYFLDGGRYEGEFKHDNKEGFGIDYYSNGNKYEGEYKNGNKEGYGIYYFLEGDRYEGEFKMVKKMDME